MTNFDFNHIKSKLALEEVKMIVRTPSLCPSKGNIWMKFVEGKVSYEKLFKVRLIGFQNNRFLYEVEDCFPIEMLQLIFGYQAQIVEGKNIGR